MLDRREMMKRAAMAALARQNGQPELASALATGWIR